MRTRHDPCLARDIPFPVIADFDMKVATLFGMIHPAASTTAAVRCVFLIDPDQRALVRQGVMIENDFGDSGSKVDALLFVRKCFKRIRKQKN